VTNDFSRSPVIITTLTTSRMPDRGDLKKMIGKAMNDSAAQDWNGKLHVSNNNFDAAKLLSSLQSRIVVNMVSQACAEALSGLYALYKSIGLRLLGMPMLC
jgi:hypothetical protein